MTPEEKRKRHADYMRDYNKRTGCTKAAYDDPVKLAKQREKWKAANARWRAKNSEKHRSWAKRYAIANPEKVKAAAKKYQTEHLADIRVSKRAYRERNRLRIRKYMREYQAMRTETDENHKLKCRLASRIRSALLRKGLRKCEKTEKLLGCNIEFFKGYIEARFEKGMTWATISQIHLDHHIPCAEFDLRDPDQQRQCFNYSNLRPMWGAENMSKGRKRPETHQAELL